MKDTDQSYCRILLDVLEANGVIDVIVSPGSRNAPLLISCSYRKRLRIKVIADERNAAFVALGIAMVSKQPVVLICTSGTALYNYAPAIAEAYYQGVPLIIISADRPFEWIEQNDSQTLFQPSALREIVKKVFDIPVKNDSRNLEWYVNRIANEAFLLSMEEKCGPVHINIQLDSPLSNVTDINEPEIHRVIKVTPSAPYFSPKDFRHLNDELIGKRILVVAGFYHPDNELNKYISLFNEVPGVKILCETLSNLHLSHNPYSIDSTLSGLTEEALQELCPDIVISFGGALISRILKEYLRRMAPEIWTLGDTYYGIDVFQNLKRNIQIKPAFFFKAFSSSLKAFYKKQPEAAVSIRDYSNRWEEYRKRQLNIRERFVDEIEWSELKAFRTILNSIPRNYNLFLSNGTSVRYAQLFTDNIPHASYSNRGVSGIDGTSATALGCAFAYKGSTLLITGDLSFSYSPGILGVEGIPPNFKIIVINNKGGGIFRFISPTRYIEHRDHFFCADPHIPVKGLAEAYSWRYMKAESEETLKELLPSFYSENENCILEVISDEEYSASILRKYMRL